MSFIFAKKWKADKYFSEMFQFDTDAHWVLKAQKWDFKFLLEPFSNSCALKSSILKENIEGVGTSSWLSSSTDLHLDLLTYKYKIQSVQGNLLGGG